MPEVKLKENLYNFLDNRYARQGGSKKFIEMYNDPKITQRKMAIQFDITERQLNDWVKLHRAFR